MSAKVGEVWENPDGTQYLVTGADLAAQSVCAGGNWVPHDLAAQGWTRVAASTGALETRVAALEAALP